MDKNKYRELRFTTTLQDSVLDCLKNNFDKKVQVLLNRYLQNFDGRIILEVVDADKKIIKSREIIEKAIK